MAAFGRTRTGAILFEQVNEVSMHRTGTVQRGTTELMFVMPDRLNQFRVATFATKEPETLAWIDTIPRGSILWDIGANIGLYSCYAAKARHCRVFAFEPSVFNLELLARNLYLNRASNAVTIVSLPLFEHAAEGSLNLSTTQRGGALSTFGLPIGFDGATLKTVFEFRTIGVSMDECVSKLSLPYPDYIKMDVDGIEHLILRGGADVLRRVKAISIEINDEFAEQAETARRHAAEAGLRFVAKAHSQIIEAQASFSATFNQIWER